MQLCIPSGCNTGFAALAHLKANILVQHRVSRHSYKYEQCLQDTLLSHAGDDVVTLLMCKFALVHWQQCYSMSSVYADVRTSRASAHNVKVSSQHITARARRRQLPQDLSKPSVGPFSSNEDVFACKCCNSLMQKTCNASGIWLGEAPTLAIGYQWCKSCQAQEYVEAYTSAGLNASCLRNLRGFSPTDEMCPARSQPIAVEDGEVQGLLNCH